MPVPRGRFGLGAPPVVEGPRKRGELYGNRIPVPSRAISGGNFPPSRPTSYDQRRSFSTSITLTDFDDDRLDFSPTTSPTLTLPPDSPNSIASIPDISPSFVDFTNSKQNLTRATSFAQALEVARKAEIEKQERENTINLSSRSPPRSADDGHRGSSIEITPKIVVSSEDVSPIIVPEIPIVHATSVPSATPRDSLPLEEKVQPNEELSYKPPPEKTVIANGASPVVMTATPNPLVAKEGARVGTPPLNIRKRAPTISITDQVSKDPDTKTVPTEPQVLVSPVPQAAVKLHNVSAWISDTHKKATVDSIPILQPMLVELDEPVPNENLEPKLSAPEMLPTLPPPDIVIEPEENVQEPVDAKNGPFINSNPGVRSREVGLTLDTEKLDDENLTSPPLQSGMLKFLEKTLILIFDVDHEPHQATSAPPALDLFPNSLAAITSPNSFLPQHVMGLQSPSSGNSSLGSRPMSMIESSPKVITEMLRMTPATSRGIPTFLPGNHARPRKSDFVYFPPTPDHEDSDLASLTTQKASHPTRMRSGSDPEDIRSMPSNQTFSAVVHRKVRETPASATFPNNKVRPLPQTPQAQRFQRATILETPLSPGHGELAALLHEAVLLENTLNKGELPSEDPQLEEARQKEKAANEKEAAAAEAKAEAKAEEEERSRLALASAQLQIKRDEPTAGRLKHTFLIPLSKARSRHRKEVYTAKAESFFSKSEESSASSIQPKSAGLPSQSTNSFSTSSATLPRMPTRQPSVDSGNSTAQLPIKSPKFSSLRKFGSISRTGGASIRTSHSTSSEVSSEETTSAVTTDEFGRGTGSTLSFPSVSPKKSSSTFARATSFAGKLFNRGRTKSGGSTLSSTSEVNGKNSKCYFTYRSLIILYLDHHVVDDSPIKTPVPRNPIVPTAPGFPALPSHREIPPLSLDEPTLRRSTSSKRSAIYFSAGPELTTAVSELPSIPPITSQTSSSLLLPISKESTPPSSATSISSVSSLPSPLFNRELVDAFPSVPATTPTSVSFSHREMNIPTPTKASFDSALLSSAIHLTSTYKTGTPKAKSKPLPSERSATPTSISHT